MGTNHRKMSEMLKEMSELVLRDPRAIPSSEAAHVALLLANIAWNASVGLDHTIDGYRNVISSIEASRPNLWNELKSTDITTMIGELVRFKKEHFPDDQRRILTAGIPNGTIRVEWLPAADPGINPKWQMQLYGLVRVGEKQKAAAFLQESQGISKAEATKRVAAIAAELGVA